MFTTYHSQTIQGNNSLEGYLFLPPGDQICGAVIILHERYGMAQHTLDLAKKLSDAGFVAFAPDLFAGRYISREAVLNGEERVYLKDSECADIIDSGINFLKQHDRIDPGKIVVMGVCQSGRYPLVVNSRRMDIAANVVYYGAVGRKEWDPNELHEEPMQEIISRLDAPSLFVFGERDHIISFDDVKRLRDCLEASGKSFRMKIYANVPHGFLNDTMPGRYRHEPAQEAWNQLLVFLDEVFSGQWPQNTLRWEFQSQISTDYDFSKNVRM
jgi:carboxymethylenebutenolidase